MTLILISFVTVAFDSLVRIFLFIPIGLHNILFQLDFNTLYGIFIAGAVDSYIEDLLVVIVSLLIGVPLLRTLIHLDFLKENS